MASSTNSVGYVDSQSGGNSAAATALIVKDAMDNEDKDDQQGTSDECAPG